ncbi:hypothetical protein [Mesorhizobium sp. M0816]|uniref:hypothetical protein n=1 Tax=Mesorhizobium sp. M0816 TaxID=2957006 RepID=UPI00333DE6A5
MTSLFAMAQHSAMIKRLANDLSRSGVLLVTTCSRVVVYGQVHALRNIDGTIFSDFSSEGIEAAAAIPQRLAAGEPHSIVLIATADVGDEYQAILQNALLRLEPRTIVDPSSILALSNTVVRKLGYVTMYDEEFLRFVDQNSKPLALQLLWAVRTVHIQQVYPADGATRGCS